MTVIEKLWNEANGSFYSVIGFPAEFAETVFYIGRGYGNKGHGCWAKRPLAYAVDAVRAPHQCFSWFKLRSHLDSRYLFLFVVILNSDANTGIILKNVPDYGKLHSRVHGKLCDADDFSVTRIWAQNAVRASSIGVHEMNL